ncbi:MAG: TerB family tellurite resistance protein [Magnetovibrio sp.]|nr:TerB family tellurite resistance protein [Magnetovibrio sp.]
MLKRLKKILSIKAADPSAAQPQADLNLAAAALLVEAAVMDGQFDDDERVTITALLKNKFTLADVEVTQLISDAEQTVANANELFTLTRTVKNGFAHEDRVSMIEMLWEVVYADGELHDYESNLVRRLTGLLHVSDRESGDARKRVLAKLKIQ